MVFHGLKKNLCEDDIFGDFFFSIGLMLIYFANKVLSSQNYGFSSSHVWMWELDHIEELKLLNCGVGEDSWESLGQQGDPTSPS